MQLTSIRLEGYKSISNLELALQPLNVLIGANGAGKSNFISLFRTLNQLVDMNFQRHVSMSGGADTFLYYGSKQTQKISVFLAFGQNAYECEWIPTADDSLVLDREVIYFQGRGFARPFEQTIGLAQRETSLHKEAENPRNRIAQHVVSTLKDWKLYHFHDTSDTAAVKRTGEINDNAYLRPDAANLAAFLFRLRHQSPIHYQMIRGVVRQVAPFFDDFLLRPSPLNENKIQLEWNERGSDFPFRAHHLSDGTLRFICLATLLLQPNLPSIILIDEPELGLHPYAISLLADLFRTASSRSQLIVSTQSVPLVNYFEPHDLLIVDRVEVPETRLHSTTIERQSDDEVQSWLGEYSLGDLWEKNVLGGRPNK
ncbi:hypothetical protein D3C86_1031860 [compost metagenome]